MRAWKAALLVAAAAARMRDRPAKICREHGSVLVHVLPIEVQPGLKAQRVARAEADGLHLACGEQRPREPLRIFRGDRDLIAILTGIAGARDQALRACDGKRAGAHERELARLGR